MDADTGIINDEIHRVGSFTDALCNTMYTQHIPSNNIVVTESSAFFIRLAMRFYLISRAVRNVYTWRR